ncbi:phospholipase [Nocardioides agariphilus]|uniref:Phospholipase n=1 Tax=Nocardioides agariphilus TaxID=433664 RepID=A0A930VSU5_9ACTN|nr:phospholipase [Nocardioides agariphilus]
MAEVTDWFLTRAERDNDAAWVDRVHPDRAWSEGNRCWPLIDGVAYFRELHDRLEATRESDLVLFTDWQGDADELLVADDPTSSVVDVLARADERGVDVRGLIWRSHWDKFGFFSRENRTLGEELQSRGAEALLDMRVRNGGSHHQKFVVIRHRDDASRDIAFVGGIDLAHARRDDHRHLGDPQNEPLACEYGDRPPWHDAMVAITGPAVHDVETTFRERWEDPAPLSRRPDHWLADKVRGLDRSPDPLPTQQPPPPQVAGGTHAVQLLRTYPNLRQARDYPFAPGGERSVALGYAKAAGLARRLIYVEDQYFWGNEIAATFLDPLVDNPGLHLMCVLPLYPDLEGSSRTPQLLGRQRAIRDLMEAAPGRVSAYGLENEVGTPVYVHAKVCLIDDVWATTGSDNFNRRSWTHDSELTAALVDRADGDVSPYAQALRLRLAAEHLGRLPGDPAALSDGQDFRVIVPDCVEPEDMVAAYAASADALEAWHRGGRAGERPPGRLRRLEVPDLPLRTRIWARLPLRVVQDPDGRPWQFRKNRRF